MNKVIQFGENVEGYDIPVLNEREIRAAAGILFLFAFIAIASAISSGGGGVRVHGYRLSSAQYRSETKECPLHYG